MVCTLNFLSLRCYICVTHRTLVSLGVTCVTRLQVCDEVDKFAGDIAHLDGLHFEQELNSDFVLAARLNLSK